MRVALSPMSSCEYRGSRRVACQMNYELDDSGGSKGEQELLELVMVIVKIGFRQRKHVRQNPASSG